MVSSVNGVWSVAGTFSSWSRLHPAESRITFGDGVKRRNLPPDHRLAFVATYVAHLRSPYFDKIYLHIKVKDGHRGLVLKCQNKKKAPGKLVRPTHYFGGRLGQMGRVLIKQISTALESGGGPSRREDWF